MKPTRTANHGRPLTYREKKGQRTISLTNTAWDSLQAQAAAVELSVSEYIEQTARRSEAVEIPIYARIRSILQPNVTLFWSLAEFTRRTAVQLGLMEELVFKDIDAKFLAAKREQQAEIQQQIVTEYITKALKIVLAMNCAFSELEVRHLTPFLCLLIYRLMLPHARQVAMIEPHEQISAAEIDRSISLIHEALKQLKIFSPQQYQTLQLRFVGGLNWNQIAKFKLFNEGKTLPSHAIRDEIKQALHQLRRYLHLSAEVFTIDPHNIDLEFAHAEALIYYQICSKSQLIEADRFKLESLLIKACTDTKLNFWLREIDHWAGHQLLDNRDRSRHVDPDNHYADLNDAISAKISIDLDLTNNTQKTEVKSYLEQLNRQISVCTNTAEIRSVLSTVVAKESGIEGLLLNLPGV